MSRVWAVSGHWWLYWTVLHALYCTVLQVTRTIRTTGSSATMSSPPRESSLPKNCGNIRKVISNSPSYHTSLILIE